MSAAQELARCGFQVEVFERRAIPGGKARSLPVVEPSSFRRGSEAGPTPSGRALGRRPRRSLPGEHGFRFFPRFYRHVVKTMENIPLPQGGHVAQNLVDTTRVHMARFEQPPLLLPARFPRTGGDLHASLMAVVSVLGGQLGIPFEDITFFGGKMWQILSSCEERRLTEYERIGWWDFIEARGRSEAYRKFFGNAITRSLVAAKAQRASTKTIGDIFLQIFFDILTPGISSDRVLNGPTNDVWIEPWLAHLQNQGVRYHFDAEVRSINVAGGAIRSATIAQGARTFEVQGDHFVAAIPVERMAGLLSDDLLAVDPSLVNLRELSDYVEWMNGIQFYLTEDVPIAHGHSIYADSPWALTSVSQPQFWRGYRMSDYEDGNVQGILSVDISDWDRPGLNGKRAEQCSREEIAQEVWEQLKRSLNVGGAMVLRDDMLHRWFLDQDIVDTDPLVPGMELNVEPLLVNYVDTWRLRPEATTRIPNFFLASDYVRTFTDLATMESANEAARRAVNGILDASGVNETRCELFNLHEPEPFLPLRAYDRLRFRRRLPWDGQAMLVAQSAVELLSRFRSQAPASEGELPLPPAAPEGLQGMLGIAQRMVVAPERAAVPSADAISPPPRPAEDNQRDASPASPREAPSLQNLRRVRITPAP